MTSKTDMLDRIATTLNTSVAEMVEGSGKAAYLRQCTHLLALFDALPTHEARENCIKAVELAAQNSSQQR